MTDDNGAELEYAQLNSVSRSDVKNPDTDTPKREQNRTSLRDFVQSLSRNLTHLSETEKRNVVLTLGTITLAAIMMLNPPAEGREVQAMQAGSRATPDWSEMIAAMNATAAETPRPERGLIQKTPTPPVDVSLLHNQDRAEPIPPQTEPARVQRYTQPPDDPAERMSNRKQEKSYIVQDGENDCGAAVMAMVLSDNGHGNVNEVYKRIMSVFDLQNKPNLLLGPTALLDYLKKYESDIHLETRGMQEEDPGQLKELIEQHGSIIVDVTSKYGRESQKNTANHWIVVDQIMTGTGGTLYAKVRDPLHYKDAALPARQLFSFMTPSDNGSVLIPVNILLPAMGKNMIYIQE